MRPTIQILDDQVVADIISQSIDLLGSIGVKIGSPEALELLYSSGAVIDRNHNIAQISENMVQHALKSVPTEFHLYNALGEPTVRYAGDDVHFDPGSSGIHILDFDTRAHRPSQSEDLVQIIKISEYLPAYDAQSTAVICHDVPEEIGDFYRLYLVLLYSHKPIVTGAFTSDTGHVMFDLLEISAGSQSKMRYEPRAIFDVCPSPPLNWTNFASQNLVDLARAHIPAQIVSMPLTGATSPVTLIGSIIQHTAECLSGITIHQLASPGAPIVWGGAPALFDMRYGTTSVGAAETALIISGYAQIGKFFNLPTHTYLSATDSKLVDVQSGMESAATALIGALSGINMISGAGMLDSLACQSLEKLVLDAESIAMANRILRGVKIPQEGLNLDDFENFSFGDTFLQHSRTRQRYREELFMPTKIIDRDTLRSWNDTGKSDSLARAHAQVLDILNTYQRPSISNETESALSQVVAAHASQVGLDELPGVPED